MTDQELRQKTEKFREELSQNYPGFAQKISEINLYSEIKGENKGMISPYVIENFGKEIDELQFGVAAKKYELMRMAGMGIDLPQPKMMQNLHSEQLKKKYNEYYQMKNPDLELLLDPSYKSKINQIREQELAKSKIIKEKEPTFSTKDKPVETGRSLSKSIHNPNLVSQRIDKPKPTKPITQKVTYLLT